MANQQESAKNIWSQLKSESRARQLNFMFMVRNHTVQPGNPVQSISDDIDLMAIPTTNRTFAEMHILQLSRFNVVIKIPRDPQEI